MSLDTILNHAKGDPAFAFALATGLKQLQIAGEWYIESDGRSAYRPRLHANGVVCRLGYEVSWDAGEPICGFFEIRVGNASERFIIDGYYAADREMLAPHMSRAMARADEMARAQGWILP